MSGLTTSLIVALKGANDLETEGKIVRFGNGANLDTIRSLAAEKLGISGNTQELILLDGNNRVLSGIDDLRQQQVVYIDLPNKIIEVLPGPTKLPFVGNLYDLLPNTTLGWVKLFEKYGPVVDITLLGRRIIGTNDPAIAEIFAKESEYFTKKIAPTPLAEVKTFAGTGLFTSDSDAHEWKLAHKLLMPAFSPRAIKAYQEEMGLITQKTMQVLDQYKPTDNVEILEWTTKLTFETIGAIGFDYDFGLLESKDAPNHPMIDAMSYLLQMTVTRNQQAQFMKQLPTAANRKYDEAINVLYDTVTEVIDNRKASADATDATKDMLGFMLNARDEANEGLTDINVRDQIITFLIAGHDTTANTLAWCLYELNHHPDVQAKVLQEIANVGITHDKLPTVEQISNLKYMHQVLKETLRLHSPVRALSKYCKQDCIVPGGYKIPGGTGVSIQVYAMHHNPKVYPDPERFDPDRFSPEEEQKRSRFAWLPFSTGPRSCIGMAFALQEAKTVLSMFLHKYEFRHDGSVVEFDVHTSTTKPHNLFMNIYPRTNFPEPNESIPLSSVSAAADSNAPGKRTLPQLAHENAAKDVELPPITFLFGTQTGTSQDYANQLSQQAKGFGFTNVKMIEMDKWELLDTGKYEGEKSGKQRELVVLVTATYNGCPPDSAERFDKFIDSKITEEGRGSIYKGLLFTVFGVGNKNWRTYQKFPRKVDESLEELGAERFFARGEGNADKDIDAEFNDWTAHFWSYTLDVYGIAASGSQSVVPTSTSSKTTVSSVSINFVNPKDKERWEAGISNKNGVKNAVITANRELQHPKSGRSTRHIEIDITNLTSISEVEGHFYNAGDHLEVYPENNSNLVETVALHFGWILDSVFEVDPESKSDLSPRSLAANITGPCSIRNALTYYADLTSPPSRAMLAHFANQLRQTAPDTAEAFEKLILPDSNNVDGYPEFIKKHRTLIDLQKAFPQVNSLDFAQFITAVGVMQPRRYSISSSPLVKSTIASLSVGVVDDLINDHHYPGLCSSFISRSFADDQPTHIRAVFKSSKSTFDLPKDTSIPIIMISAGTGFAPFRGFLQERGAQKNRGTNVGESTLFFGCRHPDQDYIYSDELEEFKKQNVLSKLHVAFSRLTPPSPTKYVQHQILANAAEVWELMNPTKEGAIPASVYICGSGSMSRDVRRAFNSMAKSFGVASTDDEADEFVQKWIESGRYNEDVWG
ncbi:unnamed protein product [Cunninghamella blakesleeana]